MFDDVKFDTGYDCGTSEVVSFLLSIIDIPKPTEEYIEE
jgi:hypothetical protein